VRTTSGGDARSTAQRTMDRSRPLMELRPGQQQILARTTLLEGKHNDARVGAWSIALGSPACHFRPVEPRRRPSRSSSSRNKQTRQKPIPRAAETLSSSSRAFDFRRRRRALLWASFSSVNPVEKHCIRIPVVFHLYLVKIIQILTN
jgi:hypothetical protein